MFFVYFVCRFWEWSQQFNKGAPHCHPPTPHTPWYGLRTNTTKKTGNRPSGIQKFRSTELNASVLRRRKKSVTHKRLTRTLFNRIKTRQNANFRGNPLLQSHERYKNKQITSGREWRWRRATRKTKRTKIAVIGGQLCFRFVSNPRLQSFGCLVFLVAYLHRVSLHEVICLFSYCSWRSPDVILCGWLGSKHQLTNKIGLGVKGGFHWIKRMTFWWLVFRREQEDR